MSIKTKINIFGNNLKTFTKLIPSLFSKSIDLANPKEFFQNFGTYFNQGTSKNASWIFDSLDIYGKQFMKVKHRLYKFDGTEDKEILEHPILDIFKRPNKYQKWSEIKYKIFGHWNYWGVVYLLKLRDNMLVNGKGIVRGLLMLQPADVSIVAINSTLDYYYVKLNNETVKVMPEDMIAIRYPDFHSYVNGKKLIDNIEDVNEVNKSRMALQKNYFTNNGFLGVVFTTDQNLMGDNYKATESKLKDKYSGIANAGKLTLLDNGLKPVNVTQNFKDADLREMAEFNRDETLGNYKISKFQLGMGEKINRATAVENAKRFLGDEVEPLLTYFDICLTADLCFSEPNWSNLYITHDSIAPRDLDGDEQYYNFRTNTGSITINEVRIEEGEKPLVIMGTFQGKEVNLMDLPLKLLNPSAANAVGISQSQNN